MTISEFQEMNWERCLEAFDGNNREKFDLAFYGLALCGEAGELANIVKKIERGDFTLAEKRTDILKEVADVVTYCNNICSYLNADLESVALDKFDEVSRRVGWKDAQDWVQSIL